MQRKILRSTALRTNDNVKRSFSFTVRQLIKQTLQNAIFPVIYKWYARKPVDQGLVIFADAHKNELPYSMQEMHRAVEKTGLKIIDCFCDYQQLSALGSFKAACGFIKQYATAEYVFICDNFLPVSSCRKRKETEVIQLWHAGGILKKYAYDTPDDIPKNYKGNVFSNYTLLTVSAECCIPVYERAMRQPKGVVKPLGLSRTDIFFRQSYLDECRELLYRTYPEAKGKKVALWAPTFRGKAIDPKIIGVKYIERMKKELGDDWFVITKLHPHLQNKLGISGDGMTTEQLLPAVDVLITDYSSVIFDAVLVDLPMVLYVPDRREYEEKRGFYIPLEEIPSVITENGAELAKCVKQTYSGIDKKRIAAFREKYMKMCDGNATERILRELGIKE